MHTEDSIVMHAPIGRIFECASNVSRWPEILPHYRWIRFPQQSSTRTVVQMAARRKWLPVRWTSELEVDPGAMEIRFRHLKAFTKGMNVVWTFTETSDGVLVRICHDLQPTVPFIGTFIAETIIGRFFIGYIANETLVNMKRYVETLNAE
jgi:ribosome-associated toxin RatA of RatAB toxin-antitoxin module